MAKLYDNNTTKAISIVPRNQTDGDKANSEGVKCLLNSSATSRENSTRHR